MINPILRLVIFISITFFYFGCNTAKSPISNKNKIENFNLKEGVFDKSFTVGNSANWNMKLSIPKIKSGENYPLILALHWAGNSTTYKGYADCLAFPAFNNLGAIIVAPSGDGLHWTDPKNEKKIIDLIDEIKKYWPISERKIIITGYSNGGIGTWFLADKYPELFAAAIPIAGFYQPANLRVPTYAIHGKADELFSVKEVENTIKLSREKGSEIELEIIDKFSHYMGCAYVEVLRKKGLKIKSTLF